MNIRQELETRVSLALQAAGAPEGSPAMISPSGRPDMADYQANGVMAAAKRARTNPKELARKLEAMLSDGEHSLMDIADKAEVAGPGFINIRLKDEWLSRQLCAAAKDDRLGIQPPEHRQTVVVDYSAPNLAKEMHVGHLRSTIIGDCLARTLEFAGHNVIRQNHVGDWGTQFGMLLAYMDRKASAGLEKARMELSDLEEFYRQAKQLFDADPAFADEARQAVVRLQAGDEHCLKNWRMFLAESMEHCRHIYGKLGVTLSDDHIRGESSYNDDLPKVIEALQAKGMLKESQGAQCVFLEGFAAKDGTPLPLIVQKSDDGYLYATTDLAAMRYRIGCLKAGRILYVVGSPQSLHFQMVFAAARQAGFLPEDVCVEHIAFGTVMGSDGKPFKTRTGGTVKLIDLLNEAIEKAMSLVSQKNQDDVEKGRAAPLSDEQKKQVAQAVGIGAVKYADLCQNRTSDYVFSFDKMLALDGNTAPYMQYAYARVRSIFRKAGQEGQAASSTIRIEQPQERSLSLKLLQFNEVVAMVAQDCQPNVLCAYLYDLAGAFTGFYENCPVLKSEEPLRASRLALCDLTARTISTGLGLLGIQTIEQM